jgi:hypothetical protein
MNMQWSGVRYWTSFVQDTTDGFAGVRLHQEKAGIESIAAEVIFWDAMGQFFSQTFSEVPLNVLEALIAEAKTAVPIS